MDVVLKVVLFAIKISSCPDQQNEIKYHLERERMKRKKLSTKKIRKRRKGQEAIKNKTK